jgi:DNA repair protein RadC
MLVLLHNHPSGDPTPSQDDIRVTERMRQSAQLLDMNLVDHIIIGDNQYFSFKEQSI